MRHIKFTLTAKAGPKTLATVEGLPMHKGHIRLSDADRIIETEHLLERLFGIRFHIQSEEVTQ